MSIAAGPTFRGAAAPGLLLRPDRKRHGLRAADPARPRALRALDAVLRLEPQRRARAARQQRPRVLQGGRRSSWRVAPGQPPRLYTEADGWKPLQIWGMGIASHDLDGDGYPEVFLTSMSDNKLQRLGPDRRSRAMSTSAFKRGVTAHRPYVGGDVPRRPPGTRSSPTSTTTASPISSSSRGNIGAMPDFATLDPNNLLLQQPDGPLHRGRHLASTRQRCAAAGAGCSST